jgi:hypothetical protein
MRPTQIDGLLPAWHRAWVIWEFTGGLDLTPLRATIKAVDGHAGAPAIDPRILLALWMYAISGGWGRRVNWIGCVRATTRTAGSWVG